MFLLQCHGVDKSTTEHINKLSLKDSIDSSINSSDKSNYINLFGKTYLKGTLDHHAEELFTQCRLYFSLLNNGSRNNRLPNIFLAKYNLTDYQFLRKSILDVFIYIKNTLKDILHHNTFGSLVKPPDVKDFISSFRCLLGPVTILPDFILQNYVSDLGNECSLPAFHIFHLYIELLWLNFVISIQYKYIDSLSTEEKLLESQDFFSQNTFSNANTPVDSNIEMEIEWVLYNLMSFLSKRYDKGSKGVFPCNCIRDVWISFQRSVDLLTAERKCEGFWKYFNNVIIKYILPSGEPTNKNKKLCNNFFNMVNVRSERPLEFSLILLSKLSTIDDSDILDSTCQQNAISNLPVLETILKNIANNETTSEASMRNVMKNVLKICNASTEPKSEVIMLLWEYFHKRLNSAFSVVGQDDSLANVHKHFYNSSIPAIIADLNLFVNMGDLSRNHIVLENSFSLFITLLGSYLKSCTSLNQNNHCHKIKGRILPKFNLNKINQLNEFGLKNFSLLFLVISKATDSSDMCVKLRELIDQLSFDNLPFKNKQVIIKIHLMIIYILGEYDKSVGKACVSIKSIMNKYCTMRDTESMSLVKTTLSGYLEVLDNSSEFQNDEYILLDSWIPKYVSVCNITDVYDVLDTFANLLSKLRIFASYQMDLGESCLQLIDAFFIHILPMTKTSYSNKMSALQIADLACGFLKFVFEHEHFSKKYENFENLLKYFVEAENANERVTRHLLNLILQDDQILASFSNRYKNCQTLIIQCWIKCLLISTDEYSDDDTHLMLLICQLEEFSDLDITPGYNNSEQKSLSKFFEALNRKWNNFQNLGEKNNFKKRINLYMGNLVKYVSTITKSPTSSQHCMRLFAALASLFLHCSQIIYTTADPNCLLHSLINSIFLPPQIFMNKKHHPHVMAAICNYWFTFMKGLHVLKADVYIDKVMKDMIIQYLPHFVDKVFSVDIPYGSTYRMIPDDCTTDMVLERYILEKISSTFVTCRGKQSHVHSTKALCIIHQLCNTNNVNLLIVVISCTLWSILEQLMFSDAFHSNKKVSEQIFISICNANCHKEHISVRNEIQETLIKTCKKHLAFNSNAFFTLIQNLIPIIDVSIMESLIIVIKIEITKIEKMRGVGFDQRLRNGLNEIEQCIQQRKTVEIN